MNTRKNALILTSTLLAAAACSGGGGGGGNQNNQPLPSATLSTLFADRLTAPADGATEVTLTVGARSLTNEQLKSRAVRFAAVGAGAVLQPESAQTDAAGEAVTKLTCTAPGVVTITASIDPDGNRVELSAPVQINFTPVDAPVLSSFARYVDVDGSASLSQGDELALRFSIPVMLDGATAADFVLPVVGDTLGVGAQVAMGADDREVVITLGTAPVLRTRGRFAASQIENGSPSAVELTSGTNAIRSVSTSTAAVSTGAADVLPAYADTNAILASGGLVASGDTSNNGTDDVVVVDGTQLTEFVSNGDGSFLAGGTAQFAEQAQAVAVADLNNFTRAEVVVGLPSGTQVFNSTQAGSGASTFSVGAFLASGDTRAVVVGDVNNDGYPDIVTGGPNGAAAWLHQRNFGNSFTFSNNAVGNDVQSLQLADLDGDGNLDLVIGTSTGTDVFRGDGTSQFVAVGSLSTSGLDVAVGEFNGDDRLDIATADGNQIVTHLNQGGLSFVENTPVALATTQLVAVDVDGDSFDDLIVVATGAVRQLMNDRLGAFEDADYELALAGRLTTLDFDGDGDRDIASVGNSSFALRSSLAGSRGQTRFDRERNLGADTGRKQAFGDLNGDGLVDRLLGTSAGAQVWLADGAGSFTFTPSAATQLGSDDVRAVALADFDADGDLDAVLGVFASNNSVWQNDGSGQFVQVQTLGGNTQTEAVCVLDFESDGDLDVIFGSNGANDVFTNQSTAGTIALTAFTGAFIAPSNTVLLRDTVELLARDVDNDGDDDLVVVNRGTVQSPQDSYLFKQSIVNGIPQLSLSVTYNAQLMSPAAAFGDIDQDGFVDLVVTRVSPLGNATIQFYRGQRTTISNLPNNIAATPQIEAVTVFVADLNGDGRNDLAFGERSGGAQVLFADGQGGFASTPLATSALGQLSPLDVDRDGDLDIVTAEAAVDRVIENR